MHTQTVPDQRYKSALEVSDPRLHLVPAAGSAEEAAMLERFEHLFVHYTAENLAANLKSVYAERVYFRDAFKQLDSVHEIEDYLIEGLKPMHTVKFVFNRVIRTDNEFYIDWTMKLKFKKTPDVWEESIGMTHIRFNAEGKVIFHQDYWDPTDIVYRRIPIAKQLIAYVKSKL